MSFEIDNFKFFDQSIKKFYKIDKPFRIEYYMVESTNPYFKSFARYFIYGHFKQKMKMLERKLNHDNFKVVDEKFILIIEYQWGIGGINGVSGYHRITKNNIDAYKRTVGILTPEIKEILSI